MGALITALQARPIPNANEMILKEPIAKVRRIHEGFVLLSDTFALSLKEFE